MKYITGSVKFFFLLFLLSHPIEPVFSQPKELPRLTLGVLPFSHAGVQQHEAVSLSHRLHSGLVQTRQFRVVEIEKVSDLLHEMGLQQTGACTDEICVAQAGNMLGAQWMVTGAVGKVGWTYTVDVRIIDVETRQTILTITRDFRGVIDALLSLMYDIAEEMAEKTAQKLKAGGLEVDVFPADAAVYLDGMFRGYAPLEIKTVPIGEHRLEIKKEGYLNWEDTIIIEPLRTRKIDEALKRLCILTLNSVPAGATVFIDDEYIGKTPCSQTLPEGYYKLKLRKRYHLIHEQNISLNKNETLTIELKKDQKWLSRPPKLRTKNRSQLREKRSSKKWLWMVGGTVLVGGGITAWMLTQKAEEEKPVEVIGLPPEPPIQ